MRYWLDTEFIEDGRTIDLVSIGVVADDGREYYAQATDASWYGANQWVVENVLSQLQPCPQSSGTDFSLQKANHHIAGRCRNDCPWNRRPEIAASIRDFCDPDQYGKPEFWGYFADYDWVSLCQLFGTMMDLPKGWPMYCRDLKQWCDDLGNPRLPEQGKGEHHALADARWNRSAWEFLRNRGGVTS